MLFTVLGHRHILDQFVAKNKGKKLNTPDGAVKLTDFLISTFMYRIDEMRNKFKEHNPEEEVSMYQPSTSEEGGDEMNLLEQEGIGVGENRVSERRSQARHREVPRRIQQVADHRTRRQVSRQLHSHVRPCSGSCSLSRRLRKFLAVR